MGQYVAVFKKMMPKAWQSSLGITGLETAIVLIAFVVVSSVFAFATLSTGLFSSDKARETINAGHSEAAGTLEIRGTLVAKANGGKTAIDELSFLVANAAAGEPIDLTPGKTIITYTDADQTVTLANSASTGGFTTTALGNADSDTLLERGETFEVKIIGLETKLNPDLGVDKPFTVQVKPPKGAVVRNGRRTPVVLEGFNDMG